MKQLKILSVLFIFVIFSTSCSKDDDEASDFDGSIESVKDFFTPELVVALEDLGFNINQGDTPPNIEGSYLSAPVKLEASTVSGDFVGKSFPDYTSIFSNQNNSRLKIDFNGMGGSQTDEGYGSLISGTDNKFSVYLKLTSQISGSVEVVSAYAISGRMTDNGIEDFQMAILMLDDKGDPDGVYIENNTGRLLYDTDNFSEKIN